jgi:hypothetical protein
MPKNTGKKFEDLIKLSALEQGIDYTRLKDSGWTGEKTTRRFTSKNICDMILFASPSIYFVEAKSRKSSLRFDEITQLDELEKKWKPDSDIYSGIIVELSGRAFWMMYPGIKNAQRMLGKKSFNQFDAEVYGTEIELFAPKGKRKQRLMLSFI